MSDRKYRAYWLLKTELTSRRHKLPSRVASWVINQISDFDSMADMNSTLAKLDPVKDKASADTFIRAEADRLRDITRESLTHNHSNRLGLYGSTLTHLRGFGKKTALDLIDWAQPDRVHTTILKLVEGLPKRRLRWLDTLRDRLILAKANVKRIEKEIKRLEENPPTDG